MKKVYKIIILIFLLNSCSTPQSPEEIKYQEAQQMMSVGATFPVYNLMNGTDESITSTQFDEGYVFYMFWGTWCASCIDNIVAVREMKKKGLLKNVEFVSISVDEEADRWRKFLDQYDMKDYMTNVLLGKDREHPLSSFVYKKLSLPKEENKDQEYRYGYIMPAYCLVKDGIIKENFPKVLPKDKEKFLAQFE